ncbi:uncharacterized protein LOC118413971 [Branchiostoma floridae]|uniref:Uncharacterized protein LOC118413971 n=2 Tax=Branchiostoma floridae TaxID=7739 RepID=A0A9J7L0A5_BRAFL|nr:uncharacterized protein LOC118413971 [Branchiostoma floridae]
MLRSRSYEAVPDSEGVGSPGGKVRRRRNFYRLCSCKFCLPAMGTSLVLVFVVVFSVYLANGYPIHASCTIDWGFSQNCSAVNASLVKQINTWTSSDNCKNGGEMCLYKFVSASGTELKATHTTPVKNYVDDLTFTFTPGQTAQTKCRVKAHSTSETWYAYLDYSTNYCNLRNLAEGAGLTDTPNFTEVTEDSICTQYSSRNCTKY